MSFEEELMKYRLFLDEFSAQNKSDEDYNFSAVKVYSYRLNESEIDAEIIGCCLQYLFENKCPIKLQGPIIQFVLESLHEALKSKTNPDLYGYDENDKSFEPLKIKAYALNKVQLYCQQLLDNVEFNKILPKLQNPDTTPLYAVSSVRNKRRYMEDRYCIINNFDSIYNIKSTTDDFNNCMKETNFYGVFDGHDGIHAAYYTSSQLPHALAKNPLYLTDPSEALRESFLSIDAAFVEKAYTQSVKGGTTAVCALHRPQEKQLYVAWVGDSRALLVKQGKILQIVESHRPDNIKEQKRIKSNGGCVINWCGVLRVDGLLTLTRSIGDSRCKPYVCADPAIVALELDNDEDFLVLGCDGLWDHVREEDIASIVYEQLKEDCEDLQKITKKLVEKAKLENSSDNITIVIAFLKHPSQIAKSSWKLEVLEQKCLNSIQEEELVDEEKVLRNQYENINKNQNLDEVDLLNLTSFVNENFTSARNDEMQRSDAELEEKFQLHFSSGKNFDDNEIRAPANQLDSENPIESEIGDDSEEDEWNYIQLKEGEGEKKIIQSEMIVSTKLAGDIPYEIKDKDEMKDDLELPKDLKRQDLLDLNENHFINETLSNKDCYLNGNIKSDINTDMKVISPKLRLKLNDEIIAQSPRKNLSANMENILVPNEIEFECEANKRPHDTEFKENFVVEIENIQPSEDNFQADTNAHSHEITLVNDISVETLTLSNDQINSFLKNNEAEIVQNNLIIKGQTSSNTSFNKNEKNNNDIKNLTSTETEKYSPEEIISGVTNIKLDVFTKSVVAEKTSETQQPTGSRTTNFSKLKTLKTSARSTKLVNVKPVHATKTLVEKKPLSYSKSHVDTKSTATVPPRKLISIRSVATKIPNVNIPATIKSSTLQNPIKSRPNSVQSNSIPLRKSNPSDGLSKPTTKRLIPRETVSSALRKNEATKIPASRVLTKSTVSSIKSFPMTTTKSGLATSRKVTSETTVRINKISSTVRDRGNTKKTNVKEKINEKSEEKTESLPNSK